MLRLGGTASTSHMVVFQGLQKYLLDRGVESDWVLYSGYDALVEAFVSREIDVAWNGPLSYVKIQDSTLAGCSVARAGHAGRGCRFHYPFHFTGWFGH